MIWYCFTDHNLSFKNYKSMEQYVDKIDMIYIIRYLFILDVKK